MDELEVLRGQLALASEFRVPLPGHPVGGYGEIVVRRERTGSDRWAVTDGAVAAQRCWVEESGWKYISDVGRAIAYRHTLDEALLLAEKAAEFEAAFLARVVPLRSEERATWPTAPTVGLEQVLAVAQRLFRTLTGRDDERPSLSEEVLEVIWPAMPQDVRHGYPARLEQFVDQRRARLEQLYREFGPGSALAGHGRYELVSQPVGIVLCERLDAAPMWLSGTWEGELPEQWLADVAEAWVVPLP